MELAGQRRCAVHEPVTALDKAEQSQKKQDAGIIISFLPISLRAQIAPHHITKAVLYMIPNFRVEYNALPENILSPTL